MGQLKKTVALSHTAAALLASGLYSEVQPWEETMTTHFQSGDDGHGYFLVHNTEILEPTFHLAERTLAAASGCLGHSAILTLL